MLSQIQTHKALRFCSLPPLTFLGWFATAKPAKAAMKTQSEATQARFLSHPFHLTLSRTQAP